MLKFEAVQKTKNTSKQVQNLAGGQAFLVDDEMRLKRFLIVGTHNNSIYLSNEKMTEQTVDFVKKLIVKEAWKVFNITRDVLNQKATLKRDYAIFTLAHVLAYAIKSNDTQLKNAVYNLALEEFKASPELFMFYEYLHAQTGWNRSMRRFFSNWYLTKDIKALQYQAWKYRGGRNGCSHRVLLKLAHPKTNNPQMNKIFKYMVDGTVPDQRGEGLGQLITADQASKETNPVHLKMMIEEWNLTNEVVPTQLRNDPHVWAALIPGMPALALLRNLNKLTELDLIDVFSKLILDKIAKLNVHPLKIFLVRNAYATGQSRGGISYIPDKKILNALDKRFEELLVTQVTNRKLLIAIDVSGSMSGAHLDNTSVSVMEVAAAYGWILKKMNPKSDVILFDTKVREVQGVVGMQEFIDRLVRIGGNGTNTALPFAYAVQKGIKYEAIVSLTDNEGWSNSWGWNRTGTATGLYKKYLSQFPDTIAINCAMESSSTTELDPALPWVEISGFSNNLGETVEAILAG